MALVLRGGRGGNGAKNSLATKPSISSQPIGPVIRTPGYIEIDAGRDRFDGAIARGWEAPDTDFGVEIVFPPCLPAAVGGLQQGRSNAFRISYHAGAEMPHPNEKRAIYPFKIAIASTSTSASGWASAVTQNALLAARWPPLK